MQFKQLLIGVTATLAFSAQSLANSFGVPDRPTNITPSHGESSVSVTPTLTSSEFVIKDDDGNVLGNTVLTESEWLVYQDTGVTLVGGTNLTGADRAYGETIYFDVSSSNLSLSGSSVQYAYVNHKRLELTDSSHNLLGYVELPDFIWQAENKDQYLAVRFKQFVDAVVIQWSYGDDAADTPWNLRLQAVLNNHLIGVKIDSMDLTSEFNSTYGNEGIKFCDESECFNHTFSSLYDISGNAYTCTLMSLADNCQLANRYSDTPLDDMAINQIAYGTSASNSFTVPVSLMEVSEYIWVVRHKGTLNGGSEIAGGWSNSTRFLTESTSVEVEPKYDMVVSRYNLSNWSLIEGRNYVASLTIKNKSNVSVSSFIVKISTTPGILNDLISFPSFCQLNSSDSTLLCSRSNVEIDEEFDIEFSFKMTSKWNDFQIHVSGDLDGNYAYESMDLGYINSPDQVFDFEWIGTFSKGQYSSNERISLYTEVKNNSAQPTNENSVLIVEALGNLSATGLECEKVDPNVVSQQLICDFENLSPEGVKSFYILVEQNSSTITNPSVSFQHCDGPAVISDGRASCESWAGSEYFYTDVKEDEGGSSLWFIPLLGFLVRRKKLH